MKILTHKSACIILIIVTIFSVFATGCSFLNKSSSVDEQKSGLESGFNHSLDADETTNRYCAYKSEKNEFYIDNVTLDFYYSIYYYESEEYTQKNICSFPSFDLYFSDGKDKQIFVKHVDENFVSEKYRCDFVEDENGIISKIHYNHSETHTIPKDIFTKEYCIVYFAVYSSNALEYEQKYQCIASAHIYYKLEGDKVTLSPIPFHLKEENHENSSKLNLGFIRSCSAF